MSVSPFDMQANRIMERLYRYAGSATGDALDRRMIELTDGKRYRLELEFVYEFVNENDSVLVELFMAVRKLLSEYREGKGVTKELNAALKAFMLHLYPGIGISSVNFNGCVRGWPCITVVFKDIVNAYKFAFMFELVGLPNPKQYSVNDLKRSTLFWYSLPSEFNRNRVASHRLGLSLTPER